MEWWTIIRCSSITTRMPTSTWVLLGMNKRCGRFAPCYRTSAFSSSCANKKERNDLFCLTRLLSLQKQLKPNQYGERNNFVQMHPMWQAFLGTRYGICSQCVYGALQMPSMWEHPHKAITTRQSCSLWLHVSKDMGKYGEKSTRTIAHVQIQEMLFSCGSCWAARKTAKADNGR